MNTTCMRELKNKDEEAKLFDREINRLHQVDRIKVHHARNSFFNPESGSLFPTLDTMYASMNPGHSSISVDNASIDLLKAQ